MTTKHGNVYPVFLCGAGGNLAEHGITDEILSHGWVHFADRVLIPQIRAWYRGHKERPRVMLHLPFGRSPEEHGAMPFNAYGRLIDSRATLSNVGAVGEAFARLMRASNLPDFYRAMSRVWAATGAEMTFYVGTLECIDVDLYSRMKPDLFMAHVESGAGIFKPLLDDKVPVTIILDVAGSVNEHSNSWLAAQLIRRWGFTVGCEPWPHVGCECWASSPVVITSQLFRNMGRWALQRSDITGPITILDNEGGMNLDKAARITDWLRDGYDVALGGYDKPALTVEEWAKAVETAPGASA